MAGKKKQTDRDIIDRWTSNGVGIKNVKTTNKQKKAITGIKKNKKK